MSLIYCCFLWRRLQEGGNCWDDASLMSCRRGLRRERRRDLTAVNSDRHKSDLCARYGVAVVLPGIGRILPASELESSRVSMNTRNHFDLWTLVVIVLTLGLFLVALFVKGLTHDVFLEAGVFLVSVKLILLAHKNNASNDAIQRKLDEIHSALQSLRRTGGSAGGTQRSGSHSDDAQLLRSESRD
jgi:hypothetical protein